MWYNIEFGYSINKDGMIKSPSGKVWPGSKTTQDYYELTIEQNKVRVYRKLVHVTMAEKFLDIPTGDYVVDHIDNCKTNNKLSNLQHLTRANNFKKGQEVRDASKTFKAVNQYTLDDEFIATYESIKAAMICYACNGKSKTAYGYKWKYTE